MRLWLLLVTCLALAFSACSTYQEHLNRGQRLYEENEFERALAIWRDLERDTDSLKHKDRARYAYLRGMTDYRLGFRPDARHWLAIAKAIEQKHPGGLSPDWKSRMEEALEDLNQDVYGGAEELARSESTAIEHTRGDGGAPGPAREPAADGG